MEYLSEAWRMFFANPAGYVETMLRIMLFPVPFWLLWQVFRAIFGKHWKPLNCTEPLSADAHAQYWHADDRDLADAQWERVRSKSDVTNGYYRDSYIEVSEQ